MCLCIFVPASNKPMSFPPPRGSFFAPELTVPAVGRRGVKETLPLFIRKRYFVPASPCHGGIGQSRPL